MNSPCQNLLPPRIIKPILVSILITLVFLTLYLTTSTDLTFYGWYSICAVTILLVVLVTDAFEDTGIAFIFGLGLLILGGKNVVSVQDAVDGYGDALVFAVALLAVVSKGVKESTLLNYFVSYVLGADQKLSTRWALIKLLPPVMLCSGFLSNTAIVSMMIPVVTTWADKIGVPSRQLLLPMNFATLMGGMLSTIGTSVNLALSSMASAQQLDKEQMSTNIYNHTLKLLTPSSSSPHSINTINATASSYSPLEFFEIGLIGLPVCFVGYIYLVLFSPIILAEGTEERTIYTPLLTEEVAVEVEGKNCSRNNLRRTRGNSIASRYHINERLNLSNQNIIVAVIGVSSRLIDRSLSDLRFRDYYQAEVLGINRRGKSTATNKLATFVLKEGDALLLEATTIFINEHVGKGVSTNDSDFLSVTLISRKDVNIEYDQGGTESTEEKPKPWHALTALSFVLFIAIATASNFMSLAEASLCAAFGMMLTTILSRKQVMNSISARTLIVVGAGSGLTTALVQSGASSVLATGLATTFGSGDFRLLLLGLFLGTSILANMVSPMAAVSLMFPIAFHLHQANNLYRPEVVLGVLSIAGSCSFLSPYSYQTNLMVAETAGYKMIDFISLGSPLLVLVLLVTVLGAPVVWGDGPGSID